MSRLSDTKLKKREPDYEAPTPIQQILASCSKMRVMSTIDLASSFWQVLMKENTEIIPPSHIKGRCTDSK